MREIALDTETTGLDPSGGHRIVEIGAVEMVNRIRTGKTYHAYINPQRDMPEEAFRVHGLSYAFLEKQPLFKEVAAEFLEFVDGGTLVIHNKAFDMKFINFELVKEKHQPIAVDEVTCTLMMARKKFPGSPASLDALCKRFNIDLSERTKHGALLDAELLAEMYLELTGGSQAKLELISGAEQDGSGFKEIREYREARPHAASAEEIAQHTEFLEKIKDPLWKQ
jgi:DNA polymerase-3 subunit epsilon